ncbi:MAG: hypothetical protein COA69_05345 [Robiginitomaculum sp.]|nr:MAG: hypothetical protein COA69_05345 [Robiginitomaculum sp.]
MSEPEQTETAKPNSFMDMIMKNLKTILIGLIVVSFAMWGVADAFTPKTRDAAAMVGKEKITLNEFDTFFRRRLREENRKQPDARLSTKEAYARGFHRAITSQLITEKLIQIDADDLGVDVNRRDALQFVEGLEVFNNVITGKLDESRLAERLAQADTRQSRKQFERDVYKALRQDQTLTSITAGIVAPLNYADQQYRFLTEKRKVKLLHLTPQTITMPDDPTDEELKSYIEEHPNAYIAPEYRRFTLLRVEISDLLRDMEASEEEIKDQFDYKIDVGRLGTEETRSITQIVTVDQQAADLVTASINAGKTIDEVVEDLGLESPVIYTDILQSAVLDPKTGEAGFAQERGIAQTVESSFGTWYSVIVTGINPGIVPDLDSQRSIISQEIKTEKARKFVYDIQDTLQDALAEGNTIEEAAKANGIPAASFDYVSRVGNTQNNDPMTGIGDAVGISTSDVILTELFTSDIGFEGDVFETENKGIAALRVDAIKESTQRQFEEIKEQALQAWRLDKTNEALGTLMDTLADRALAGESLEAILTSLDPEQAAGANIYEREILRLSRGLPNLSPQTNARLFETRVGPTIRGTGANGLDRVIGQIVEITPNTDVLTGSIADTLKEQASKGLDSDIQQAYHEAMLKAYPAQTLDGNISKVLGIVQ